MFRLIKICFWIAVVVLMLPENPNTDKNTANLSETAVKIAKTGLKDIGDFCTKNPDTCLQSKDAIGNIGDKTIRTARSIYDYLQDDNKNSDQNKLEEIISRSDMTSIEAQIISANAAGQTLTLSDLNIDFSTQNPQ